MERVYSYNPGACTGQTISSVSDCECYNCVCVDMMVCVYNCVCRYDGVCVQLCVGMMVNVTTVCVGMMVCVYNSVCV